jgi:ADP-L-glycero-D-manno-heptose 6-epimerase
MMVVTGGAGFIGSNLVAALEAAGRREIVVCDRFGQDEKWRNLAKRELADIVAPERLLDYLAAHRRETEAVLHLGAISSTTERDADLIIANNFKLSLDLWNWCAAAGVPLLYASSAATYGDGARGFADDDSPAGLATLRPLNAYGWSKHLFDRRVARIVAENGPAPPHWAGLKFFNVYGPNEYHKGAMRSVVIQVFERVERGDVARLFRSHRVGIPDGGQQRDFVSVSDCVAMTLWLLDHPRVNGIFNIGSGKARSFADLARAVYRAMGREPVIEFIDTPIDIREKYQYFTEGPIDRLRAAGYPRPTLSLEEGVRDYVGSYLASDDRYR